MADHSSVCSNGAGEVESAWRLNGAYHPTRPAIQTPNVNAYVNIRCLTVRLGGGIPFISRAARIACDVLDEKQPEWASNEGRIGPYLLICDDFRDDSVPRRG